MAMDLGQLDLNARCFIRFEGDVAAPVDFLNKPALTHNPNGRGTALVVRDSQGNNLGPAVEEARARAYEAVERIDLEGAQYRTDIARAAGAGTSE